MSYLAWRIKVFRISFFSQACFWISEFKTFRPALTRLKFQPPGGSQAEIIMPFFCQSPLNVFISCSKCSKWWAVIVWFQVVWVKYGFGCSVEIDLVCLHNTACTNCLEKDMGDCPCLIQLLTLVQVSDYRNFLSNERWKPYNR